MKETNETIKLKYKKKDEQRSIFYVKEHIDIIMIHDTKGQGMLMLY